MSKRKTIFLSLLIISTVAILVTAIIIAVNANKQQNSSNLKNSAVPVLSSSSPNDGTVPIFTDDSDEIKSKKEEYNKLVLEGNKIHDEYMSGKMTHEEYVKEGTKLREKSDATGINPDDYETPEHRYEERFVGIMDDKDILNNDYTDDNGKVIPEYKEKYELNIKRKEYLGKVYDDYKAGKISAGEAEKSLADQYTLIK